MQRTDIETLMEENRDITGKFKELMSEAKYLVVITTASAHAWIG